MRLHVTESIDIDIATEAAFDHTNRAEHMISFEGYGPIPGIRSARYTSEGPVGLGSVRSVTKTDGSSHTERIVAFEPPSLHTSRITGIQPPLGWLLRHLDDEWRFTPTRQGTRIRREFGVDARPLAFPVALLMLPLLRRAVRRDLRNVKRALEAGAAP